MLFAARRLLDAVSKVVPRLQSRLSLIFASPRTHFDPTLQMHIKGRALITIAEVGPAAIYASLHSVKLQLL